MSDGLDDSSVPALPGNELRIKPPPHPLDQRWFIHQNDQVYGPYPGHEIKAFISEGIVESSTSVVREGRENWTKAIEDTALAKLFHADRPTAPAPAVTAAEGATIVQVTNQITPGAAFGLLEDEPFGPKSAGVALLLSILLCGAGQMYNGQIAKGILMLLGCVLLWGVLLGWTINIWSWIDAYQTAKKMNARYKRRLAAGLPI